MAERKIRQRYMRFMAAVMMLLFTLLFGTGGMQVDAATAVEENGALKVSGTKLVSQSSGQEVQLRGVSTHGINWDVGYPYISEAAFKTLRDNYGVNAIRLAMYTTEYFGYCDKGSAPELQDEVQRTLESRIDAGVKAARQLGMYVIVDWHVLSDQTPLKYQSEAKKFFRKISDRYSDYDNVLYEICNEPNGGTSWEDIKKYAGEIIPVIRSNDPDAVIIVGTPTWSQDVDVASKSPLSYDNVLYAMHFYSATHKASYRDKLKTALNNGLPVMVTEFGVSEASGDGTINTGEAKQWLDLLDSNGISYFAWSLSNKSESASLLKSGKRSGWTDADLSKAGKWVLGQYRSRSGQNRNKPAKVKALSVKNQKGKKVKVAFRKTAGAAGYQITYAANKQFKKAKSISTKKNTAVLKKLKKGKTYYIKVRAYCYTDGKTVYGAYSAVKRVKIKK
ncbi:MAG: glycoside hydrolase family 5 protein [Clostridium sp.]|nr:glycoside hydrolase family 5 protein [Clostridium sp.]